MSTLISPCPSVARITTKRLGPGALGALQRYAFPRNVHEIALEEVLENIERQAILNALDQAGNNTTTAAKLPGTSFRAMRYR